ncbi:MAG: hypothetical protein ABIH36_03375 [bacterium]
MESLLDKVDQVEQEIKDRLAQVEKDCREQLSDIRAAEGDVVEEVRVRAEKQGQQIIREQVQKTQAEINAMKQDRERSVAALHKIADGNRQQATDKVVALFAKEYTA